MAFLGPGCTHPIPRLPIQNGASKQEVKQVKACARMKKRMLAAGTSGASIVALAFLPKCPLCVAMWLSAIGFTSLFSRLTIGVAGSAFMAVVLIQFFSRIKKSPPNVSGDAAASSGKQSAHPCCK
jgi:hypothetical protein